MNIEEVREYCLSLPGTEEAMPYGEDWVVFRVGGKIFLHIWLEAPIPTIAVLTSSLRHPIKTNHPIYLKENAIFE